MNPSLLLVAIALVASSCKSRESTEVAVTVTKGSAVVDPTPETPKETTRQTLEKSMKKHYAKFGFTKFTCPDVGPTESETTCAMSADNGASYDMKIASKSKEADGSWKSWEAAETDIRVITAEELAEKINDGVMAAVKKAHPKATAELACGTSPVIFVKHKATCKLTMHEPELVREVTIDDSKGAFDWGADQF